MSILYTCPPGSEINDIPNVNCYEQIGQVQKILIQRMYDGSTRNEFTIASANPNVLASWTTFLTATDSTKVQVTPYIGSPTLPPPEPVTVGGGNDSLDGNEEIIAFNAAQFTAQLYQVPQEVILALKPYMSEQLQVYFITQNNQIIGEVDDHTTPTKFRGFEVIPKSFYVGPKGLGGHQERDANPIGFAMKYGWSDYLHVVTPAGSFKPLVDITN